MFTKKDAEQFRKALQLFVQTLTDEKAMEVPTVFPQYKVNIAYEANDILSYGENSVGDPQLYRVVQSHTSAVEWEPDKTTSLYSPIGLDNEGYVVWSRPSGAHDAYNIGDVVNYNDKLYKSLIDGNTFSPDEYPAGWEVYIK